MSKYPEHDKLVALNNKNEVVGDFIVWLGSQGYQICDRSSGEWSPTWKSIERWIEMYFEIDGRKISQEKDAMLEEIREAYRASC